MYHESGVLESYSNWAADAKDESEDYVTYCKEEYEQVEGALIIGWLYHMCEG
jgi:hypothetical protein